MNRKQYVLALALLMVAGLCGGAISGKLLAVAPAQAQQAGASKTYTGQKWEYCTLTQAGYAGSINSSGRYWISYFSDKGVQVVVMEETAFERNGPAKPLAKLGDEGWEMVGEGRLDIRNGELRALYFKRPKP